MNPGIYGICRYDQHQDHSTTNAMPLFPHHQNHEGAVITLVVSTEEVGRDTFHHKFDLMRRHQCQGITCTLKVSEPPHLNQDEIFLHSQIVVLHHQNFDAHRPSCLTNTACPKIHFLFHFASDPQLQHFCHHRLSDFLCSLLCQLEALTNLHSECKKAAAVSTEN